MHQREQLKSNHQDQQKKNKKEVSKTNQENESLLTVPGERSYKETLITQKKNVIIFGDSIPKGINTRLLNKKLIKSKAVCKFFSGVTSKDFVRYVKPTLQENEFDTSILHMGVNFEIRFQYWHCIKRYHKYCQPLQKFRCKANHYFRFDTYYAVNGKFYLPA